MPNLILRVPAIWLWLAFLLPACAQETQSLYLSGHGKDDAVPWRFMCTAGAQSGFWTNLPVPSNWELHGFGTLNYKKDSTNAWDEHGLYEHEFTVPAGWSNQRVFLVFEGVMTDTSAQLNGQLTGPPHQGGFYRFKYEVGKLVKFGETNRLEVAVAKHSANQSVNNAERLADYWVFGGIYRPVYLEAVPPQFIDRVAIDARADGTLAMDVFLDGATNADTIEAQITELDGKPVGATFAGKLAVSSLSSAKGGEGRGEEADNSKVQNPSPSILRSTATEDRQPSPRLGGAREKISLSAHVNSPRAWTAETPNLYSVEVRLKRGDEVLHRYNQRFGFRTMEVRDGDGLYVNGRRVVLKGVNRHSFWPDSGRCLSETVHRIDIETMKDANINAVRMSHYPPDAQFLDLCDELGLYVLDELAGWHKHYDTDIGTKLVGEMVTRDVNHPSILFWDNGNEGGFNTNLDRLFPEFDPQQRRVLHPWASFNGLCTAHYLAFDKADIAAAGKKVYFQPPDKEVVGTNDSTKFIYLPTEFQHGLFDGGAGAALDDYWRMMMSHSNCAGGFIWVWGDDGVKRPDTNWIDTAGNQAPDGIVGPYREREGSFYTIKEIWSPIMLSNARTATNGGFVIKLWTVENRYSFTDARDCKFTWQLRKFRGPEETVAGYTVVGQGGVDSPAIPPGGTGELNLTLPTSWLNADALAVRVHDPAGRELWTWVSPLKRIQAVATRSAAAPVKAGRTREVIELKSGDLTVALSRKTGLLLGARRGAQHFSLTNGPLPAPGSAKLTDLFCRQDGADQLVTAKFNGALKSVTWRLRANGWLQCAYQYRASGTNGFFGVTFDHPENLVLSKRWLGEGPYRVWKNRLRGGTLNVWKNDYNNTVTGWRNWVYPEFKGCFAGVRWLQLDTPEGPLTVVPEGIPFVQVLTPELPPTNLVGKAGAPLPRCGLGLLHAIPPLGSKFKDAAALGPQSQPNVGSGVCTGTVSFYFGRLP
jgi:hypothetical protein